MGGGAHRRLELTVDVAYPCSIVKSFISIGIRPSHHGKRENDPCYKQVVATLNAAKSMVKNIATLSLSRIGGWS